ncbi:MAG: M48 family metallopeptidase [Acidobacteria bacterium]|nr:M48 family metallopeptidase [Acidobacteriota bacterium]
MKTSLALAKKTTETYWDDAEALRWAVRHWAVKIGVKAPNLHLRPMKNKWASISTKGRLTLDVGLVEIPQKLGEYVIVHELLHLIAPNHGKVFKSFLFAYMPDWEQREIQLQQFLR